MKKPYATHELAYTRMRERGIDSWDQFAAGHDDPDRQIDLSLERFLEDAVDQPWVRSGGRTLELGCGTGPISRWLNDRGFSGRGIEISATAVEMAERLSQGRALTFACGDVCDPALDLDGTYDLVVDGHCLHCILTEVDRARFFANAYRALSAGGALIVATMCRPVGRRAFRDFRPNQRLVGALVYSPFDQATDYEGAQTIDGAPMIPTRRLDPWKQILREVRGAGFRPQLVRIRAWRADDPVSEIFVLATRP